MKAVNKKKREFEPIQTIDEDLEDVEIDELQDATIHENNGGAIKPSKTVGSRKKLIIFAVLMITLIFIAFIAFIAGYGIRAFGEDSSNSVSEKVDYNSLYSIRDEECLQKTCCKAIDIGNNSQGWKSLIYSK